MAYQNNQESRVRRPNLVFRLARTVINYSWAVVTLSRGAFKRPCDPQGKESEVKLGKSQPTAPGVSSHRSYSDER